MRAPIRRSGSAMRSTGRRRIDASPSSVHERPCCAGEPARQQAHQRAGVADVDRRRRARRASRRPAPRMTSSSAALLDERAERARPRAASSSCRRRRGSCAIATGSAAIAPSSAARCEIDLSGGGAQRRRAAGSAGSKRTVAHAATGEVRAPAISSRARARRRPRRHPERDRRPSRCPATGASAMSAMLIPARPSVEREVGDDPRAVGHRRRAARATGPPASSASSRRAAVARGGLVPGRQRVARRPRSASRTSLEARDRARRAASASASRLAR